MVRVQVVLRIFIQHVFTHTAGYHCFGCIAHLAYVVVCPLGIATAQVSGVAASTRHLYGTASYLRHSATCRRITLQLYRAAHRYGHLVANGIWRRHRHVQYLYGCRTIAGTPQKTPHRSGTALPTYSRLQHRSCITYAGSCARPQSSPVLIIQRTNRFFMVWAIGDF